MKANELRIGNYILFCPIWKGKIQSKRPVILKEIRTKKIVFQDCLSDVIIEIDSNEIKPIPLTPEILEKAGFEEIYKSEMHTTFYKDKVFYYFWHETNRQYANFSGNQYDHINHLHQLQNLYFALTGEELNINL